MKKTNQVILLIGIVICLISFFVDERYSLPLINFKGSDMKITLISVGCSLIASSIITFFLLSETNKNYEVVDKWGLINIYKKRSDMNLSCDRHMKNLRNELDMICFGLRNFRDAVGNDIEKKVEKGLKVRILTLKPDSMFVEQREIDEGSSNGEIKKTLIDLIKWVEKLKNIAPNKKNIQIKFYDTMPLFSYQRIDNYIYLGPYLYGLTSQKTISFEYVKNRDGYKYYKDYFERVWKDNNFCSESKN
ncbi:DUF5919 domain-containing protein [Herbivorax sp. ANBcel31]|uniref:DUF5919 domain-containing protein n=1 Tax=Herbivorax sp. ANBcel31 TaxID=3069754 RepID=UPI0027B7E95F|nr:DUF5919 domain-containing protein [Herbivorax sp. ANBcel31]MDQ2085921.1 DUF5919 domain-containing protein [Herbivorax sp. ANBcel31]